MSKDSGRSVVVVGAGVIGAAIAWRCACAGHRVTVLDPDPRASASWVAGGMLAPITEAWPGDEDVLQLGLRSLAGWPQFAEDLAVAGHDPGLSSAGTLVVGVDAADREVLRTLAGYLAEHQQPAELLDRSQLRRMEPGFGPAVRGALSVPGDLAVDNRALLRGLLDAALERGATLIERAASGVQPRLVELRGGGELRADVVVLAAGAWSGRLRAELATAVRPIKGEILRLRPRRGSLPPPRRTVRALVCARPVYLVPRADGEVVLGASQYDAGFDTEPVAAGVRDLLLDAERVLPGIADYALVECVAGLRAGSVDNLPVLGELAPGLLVASGHHRNGLLLAPGTADAVLGLIAGEQLPQEWIPAGVGRLAALAAETPASGATSSGGSR
ncbi:MAG: glycine oxidase ThiO [Sciscionella sp.]